MRIFSNYSLKANCQAGCCYVAEDDDDDKDGGGDDDDEKDIVSHLAASSQFLEGEI